MKDVKMTEKEYKEMVYDKASKVKNKKELNNLLDEIIEYGHDYGSIVYGCMAAMKAAFNVVERSPNGGITGFQAGCIGWECVHEFMMTKPPCKLIDYNNMLYPQYQDKFEKTISQTTWDALQKKAGENLNEKRSASDNIVAHWQSVRDGKIPFGFTISQS